LLRSRSQKNPNRIDVGEEFYAACEEIVGMIPACRSVALR
jgi:hypothetical protein